MKRVIRITESDLVKIIKNVLNEQPSSEFQYKMGRAKDDNFKEPTTFTEIYFKKSGGSYMVYAKKPGSNMIGDTGIVLPTEQQLLAKYDGGTEGFKNEGATIDGSDVAKSIMTNYKSTQGNFIVYTKSDGIPAMGKFVLGYNQPIDVLVGEGLTEKPLKTGQVLSLSDYIVVDKKKGFGRALTIREIVNAEVA